MAQRFLPILVQFGARGLAVSLFGCAFFGAAQIACVGCFTGGAACTATGFAAQWPR